MIKALIQNYGDLGALGAFVLLMIWYVRFQTKQQAIREGKIADQQAKREDKHDKIQTEERNFNRTLITGTLKEIHNNGLKNAELNRKSINMQKQFSKESVETLKNISDRLNGGTKGVKAIASLEAINERKKDSKVEVERRK